MTKPATSTVSSYTVKYSLIEETYRVFQEWDFSQSRERNLKRAMEANVFGAKSANWSRDVYKVLHRRFDPNGRDRPLVALAQASCDLELWKPLLLWHLTRNEYLVRDFLIRWLFPRFEDGTLRLRAEDTYPYLLELHGRGLVEAPWKETTLKRVASGLLKMAADFGLVSGMTVRAFSSYHLPEQSFLYLLHAMSETQPNALEIIRSPDWRMFLLAPDDVEREIFRLHQFRRLHYEVAGTIAQLSLPCGSASAYVKEGWS